MGKNNKKSKARQLLSNPMTNSINNPEKKSVEELQKMLRSKLSDLYSNIQVSSSEVISELSESEKTNLLHFVGSERTTSASDDETPATRRQRLDSDFVDLDFD